MPFLVREGDANDRNRASHCRRRLTANFESDKYKTDKKNGKEIDSVRIAGYTDAEKSAGEKGLSGRKIIAESQNFTRDLVNEPSNKLTPQILAERAEAMAREAGLAVEILDEQKIADLKMGALLSVAQGSAEPPRMIVVTYTPANAKPGAPVIGSGRQSRHLRHRRHLHQARRRHGKMKYDMAGGATMLGVMRAIALLKPKVKVIGRAPPRKTCPAAKRKNRATFRPPCPARPSKS